MELLDQTILELDNARTVLGDLDNHYVREIYPQFKNDFQNLEIADIDVYENYHLQNVLDDLRHIQFLNNGSPRKDQFKRKVEFLVQVSQETLKKVKKPSYEPTRESLPKKVDLGAQQISHSMKENKDKEKIKKEKQNLLPPLIKVPLDNKINEVRKKEVIKQQIQQTQVIAKDGVKIKREVKKRKSFIEAKPLTQISEEVVNEEEVSDPESPLYHMHSVKSGDDHEMHWNLNQEQQAMIQSTLKKYDMSEDVWKNYILTKIHGDAQLRRMGITIPAQKVDTHMETIRFVEELERHMSRKARTARKGASASLKPLQADIITTPPDFKQNGIFPSIKIEDFAGPQSTKSRTLTSLETPLLKKVFPSTTTAISQVIATEEENRKEQDGSSKNLANMPTELPIGLAKFRKGNSSKTWTIDTISSHTEDLNMDESLRDSLRLDQVYHYIKSQGKYQFPLLSNSNSQTKKNSELQSLETIVSSKPLTGRKYKPNKGSSLNSLGDSESLVDSLQADSLMLKRGGSFGTKNEFRISNMGTIKSKYLSTSIANGGTKQENLRNNRVQTEGQGTERERDEDTSILRSDLTSQSRSIVSDSLEERTTIQSTSINSLVHSVLSQNDGTRLQFNNNQSQVTIKTDNLPETGYSGKVKRVCLLGSGSEAKVFLCRVKDFENEVALKQYDLVKNQKGNQETYEGLGKEFEMLKNLKHDNIIQYYCLYKPQKQSYSNCIEFGIIMEYMPGGSLDVYIEENLRTMTFETKKKIMKQIISGLDFLHQHNIIHRDLKPGNILLSKDKSQVKISDFGISKKTNNDTNTRRTLVGTPWYMAPEVINQEGYSSKADIWSVGCCFFHLITGEKPYSKANAIQALLLMVNHKNPLEACTSENLEKINEHQGIKEILELCFHRNQAERPSAGELLQHPIFQ